MIARERGEGLSGFRSDGRFRAFDSGSTLATTGLASLGALAICLVCAGLGGGTASGLEVAWIGGDDEAKDLASGAGAGFGAAGTGGTAVNPGFTAGGG